ncbi:RHS repeat-associated core domain-containing protein [Clostridium sartagoforme]|uniref:RHS repeat-associated core domain-containing protein n=1 Tax=Clostridium sartagoforme TaxID=84031 RepID=UPI0031E0B5D5
MDKNGTEVVSYSYDTWGKLISIEGSLKDTVGVKNPYRYRGYRYDTETGLYYLNARYYNPEWGRFINADGIVGTPGGLLSANMFAYCGNDPVNREDSNGYLWGFIKAFVSQIANAINVFRPIYAVAGGAALVDGPLPIGDLVGLVIASVATIAVVGIATYNSITYSSESDSDDGNLEVSKKGREPSPTIDRNTGEEVGRFVADDKGNVMIEPKDGRTVSAGKGGVDTHTLYPNGSNYHRYNPNGHPPNSTIPHGHGHLKGTGPGMKGQGPSIDVNGNAVPWDSAGAHWKIR